MNISNNFNYLQNNMKDENVKSFKNDEENCLENDDWTSKAADMVSQYLNDPEKLNDLFQTE